MTRTTILVRTLVGILRHIVAGFLAITVLCAHGVDAWAQEPLDMAESPKWRCEVTQQWECELPNGCSPLPPGDVWMLLDFEDSTYQRCDSVGCDAYAMQSEQRSFFTYVQLEDRPDTFMKIGLGNLFVDVAAQGVSAMNSLGTCQPEN